MSKSFTVTKVACYIGYIVQAIVNNFLPILFIALQDIYALNYEQLGRIILVNFLTQMATDFFTPKILKYIGYKNACVLAQASAFIGLCLLGILPQLMQNTYLAILIAMTVTAFGSGLIEVVISPMVEMLPTKNKVGNMAVLHSFYCWGQVFTVLVTTAMVFISGFNNWVYIPIIWSLVPLFNFFMFLKAPIIEPPKEQKQDSFKKLFSSRRFRCYLVMMLCAGASEIAMAQWASMFAQQTLKVSKTIGDLAGPCAFAIFMGAGRIWYARISNRISFKKLMAILSSLCFICYVTVAFCQIQFIALIFCALCGFTVSIFWPGTYSAGAKDFKNGGAVMFSAFAMLGDIGCSLGPWLLGVVADKLDLKFGFLTVSIFPVAMIIATLISVKEDKKLP
ncbi:MAG: MFS transporter [Clostridia bacterium]|nr:MFS transporter [Clostridia bacterium]